jgi:hypothetical protein
MRRGLAVEAEPPPKPLLRQLFLASFACPFSTILFPSLSQLLWRWPRMPTRIGFLFLQCGGQQAKLKFLLPTSKDEVSASSKSRRRFDGMAKLHSRKVV